MAAGYSGTPLVKKLGFKPGMRVTYIGAPDHYEDLLGHLPSDIDVRARLTGKFDLIHFFTTRLSRLRTELPRLFRSLEPTGILWISWPKGTSKIDTDLNGNIVRSTILKGYEQLVDVKVCAVDDDWSGLKFVIRKEKR